MRTKLLSKLILVADFSKNDEIVLLTESWKIDGQRIWAPKKAEGIVLELLLFPFSPNSIISRYGDGFVKQNKQGSKQK